MNETELVAAFQGYLSLTNQLFFGYISLVSGFLVMSYLVAEKISLFLEWIAVALFSIVSALLLLGIFLSRNNAEQLLTFMREQARNGELDMAWLGHNPQWAGDAMSTLYFIAAFGGYLASIAYFFYIDIYQFGLLSDRHLGPLSEGGGVSLRARQRRGP